MLHCTFTASTATEVLKGINEMSHNYVRVEIRPRHADVLKLSGGFRFKQTRLHDKDSKMNPMPFCRLSSHVGFKIVFRFHSLVGAQLEGLSTLRSNSSILPISNKRNESVLKRQWIAETFTLRFTDKKAGSTSERRDCFKLL